MIVSQVVLSEDQEKTFLPSGVRGLLKKSGTTVFAVLDRQDIIALAVVTHSEIGLADYCIRYLQAYDESEIEVLGSLLENIESTCRENGSKLLAVKIIDDLSNHRQANYVLIKNDYMPTQLNGKFLMYSFKDIIETEFVKKVENLEAVKEYVKFYRQMDKKQLIDLREKLQKSDVNLDFDRPDLIFGRFFVMDDEIKGYMDMREVYPGILMLYDVYVEKSKKAKNALPMMLASVIQLTQAMMPEDTVIILPLYKEHLYKGFKTVFGKPVVEQGIYEYVKNIGDEYSGTKFENKETVRKLAHIEVEAKLELFSATPGTDTLSPAMLKGQRDIMPV